ncbi:PilW family protein [Microbulbifer rhizosphaerae]|uniref:Type IV pilus assembly protein PilW n=1 Tax=Microbulbifer rhizosphaerae TaxID=1562603 RepID=A0A7W4WF36_9GAMM|nr:PilW family protein [Microbulbifer rhizosphaerae]MBB3062421.1 type IV pilus assembly protein PilW [Microbulbifer rhizosphaerae]
MRKQRGISLVELMVSITLGLILMTGVVQLFLSSRATFSTQQAASGVQESGRLAMEFISQDIRMAGFMGCMSRHTSLTNTLKQNDSLLYRFDVAIEGADISNDGGGKAPAGYPKDIVDGTDVLVVRGATGNSVGVTQNNNGAELFAEFTNREARACDGGADRLSGLCPNDVLVVSDCAKSRIFQAVQLTAADGDTEVNVVHSGKSSAAPGNAKASWGGTSLPPSAIFGPGSQIIQIQTSIYYIAEATSGRPALWRQVGNQDPRQLLVGIENMQLEYGEDTSGDGIPDNYRNAKDIADWNCVTGVRIQLLVASVDDNALPEPQAYTFAGTEEKDPGDRRLRHVFVSTVGIRSRLP